MRRRPVVTDPGTRAHHGSRPRRARAVSPVCNLEPLNAPRPFRLSPASVGLLAAGLVGLGVLVGDFALNRDGQSTAGRPPVAVAPQLPVSDTVVRFVYVAPRATTVYVVGDFNGWDTTKTPLSRTSKDGVWSVTLPLSAGRHIYAYVVDGSWSADPHAPLAPDDGFGHANAVKLVRGGSSL